MLEEALDRPVVLWRDLDVAARPIARTLQHLVEGFVGVRPVLSHQRTGEDRVGADGVGEVEVQRRGVALCCSGLASIVSTVRLPPLLAAAATIWPKAAWNESMTSWLGRLSPPLSKSCLCLS